MSQPSNAVTASVTERVTNAAPHHTTPHHTTKNYSQRDHGTGAGTDKATTTQREVTPLDALAAAVCLIRPDWNHAAVRATLARTRGSWREIATRALRVALDDDTRTPYAIENGDMRRYGRSDAERHPSAVSYAERQAELRRITATCQHQRPSGDCPECRNGLEPRP